MNRRRKEHKSIQYQIIYWRDIPVQLRLQQGRSRLSHPLPEIFQKTIYRAAFRARAISGDAYQDSWRAEGWFRYEGSAGELDEVATAIAAEVVAAYSEARLNSLALNKGYDPSSESDG